MNKKLTKKQILNILSEVVDPEIPVISLEELGIIRDIKIKDNIPEIIITHTYSGCPANNVIELDIKMALLKYGISKFKITTSLSPAWTTDNISQSGIDKLLNYGIVPPPKLNFNNIENDFSVKCPRCNSENTEQINKFGSTSCKALYRCLECKEPFDYFKCI